MAADPKQNVLPPELKSILLYLISNERAWVNGEGNHGLDYNGVAQEDRGIIRKDYSITREQLKKDPSDVNCLKLTKEILDNAGIKTDAFVGTNILDEKNSAYLISQVQKRYNQEFRDITPGFVELRTDGQVDWYTVDAIDRIGRFISDQIDNRPNPTVTPGPLLGGVSQQDADQKLFPAAYNVLSLEVRESTINKMVPLLAGDKRAQQLIAGPQLDRDFATAHLVDLDGRGLSVKPNAMTESAWKAEKFKILVKAYQRSHNQYSRDPNERPLAETGVPDQATLIALEKDYARYNSDAAPNVSRNGPTLPPSHAAPKNVKADIDARPKRAPPLAKVDYHPDAKMEIGKGAPPEAAKWVQEIILKWKPDADIGSNQKTLDGKHVAPDNLFKEHTEARVKEMQKEINQSLPPGQHIREDGIIDKKAAVAMMQKAGIEIPANMQVTSDSVVDTNNTGKSFIASATLQESGTFTGSSYFQQNSTNARNYRSMHLTDTNFLNTSVPALPPAPVNLTLIDKPAAGTNFPGAMTGAGNKTILTKNIIPNNGALPKSSRSFGPGGTPS